MKYFRIKTGYGKNEFLSITEEELPKAIKAQVTGKVGIFKTGTIAGNHIMSITPDWNKELGYHPDYVMSGDDYNELGSLRKSEYQRVLENAQEIVVAGIENRKPVLKLSEAPVQIHTRGLTGLDQLIEKKI